MIADSKACAAEAVHCRDWAGSGGMHFFYLAHLRVPEFMNW